MGGYHVVVLAAQRMGVVNALAEAAGVSHKCVMPMGGRPLIEHVLFTLQNSKNVTGVTISIDDPAAIEDVPMVRALKQQGLLSIIRSGVSLADSVIEAVEAVDRFPVVVTTADNALLTPDMLAHFTRHFDDADVAVAMTRKEVLLAKYPDGQRRFHRFKDGEWSNCNLYALNSAEAVKAAEIFRGGGQFAKSLKRVAKSFGVLNMLLYKLAAYPRDKAFGRVGRRNGLKIKAVDLPFPEAPIDVDNERSARITGEILAARAASS